ncbi:MAG: hypothetical protein IJV39_01030 [Ruminococcus sp.]|nr:hypothetical protein [Ruminococcus sp.]
MDNKSKNKLFTIAGAIAAATVTTATVVFSVKKIKNKKAKKVHYLPETAESAQNKENETVADTDEVTVEENVTKESAEAEQIKNDIREKATNSSKTKSETVSENAKSIRDILSSDEVEIDSINEL